MPQSRKAAETHSPAKASPTIFVHPYSRAKAAYSCAVVRGSNGAARPRITSHVHVKASGGLPSQCPMVTVKLSCLPALASVKA
jgi:hypothetical protein